MKLVISKDSLASARQVAKDFVAYVNNKPKSLLLLPGGDTPLLIFKELVKMNTNNEVSFKECKFVSLDEWENLSYETKGSCKQTLFDELYLQLDIDVEKQVCFFDGKANLEDECKRMDTFIKENGPIDIAVLGIGMNGHIGFNEPGVDTNLYSAVIPLDEVTKEVSVKYFGAQLNIEHGITIGMQHFNEANQVWLIADCERKADIVKKVVEGEITNMVPASIMRNHKDATLYLDEEASSKLD